MTEGEGAKRRKVNGERRRRKDGKNESGNIIVGEMRVRIAKRKIGGGGREDRGEVMMRVIEIGVEAGVGAEDTNVVRHVHRRELRMKTNGWRRLLPRVHSLFNSNNRALHVHKQVNLMRLHILRWRLISQVPM